MAEIRVVSADELTEATGTPGIRRHVAFEGDDYWFGHVEAAPTTMSGWHHHGQTTTVGYVLRGEIRLEFGPGGRDNVVVRAGEYFRVPPELVHREGNAREAPGEVVLVRVGLGQPVFAVDGPEPA
jgi:uncharacterized RmlC-like cupin family protein